MDMISHVRPGGPRAVRALACFFLSLLGMGMAAWAQPTVTLNGNDSSGPVTASGPRPVQVKVSGRVLDADSGRPLPFFKVITGTQNRRVFEWNENNPLPYANGGFSIILTKEKMRPAVLVEAEGYLPQSSGPIYGLETNLVFRLKKGSGPAGVVLTPSGSPAAGQTVYLSRLKDLLYLEGSNMTPKAASSRLRATVTDQEGRFSFAPDIDAFSVMVMNDDGFANVRVEDLISSPRVRLLPWARVEGALKIGTKTGAHETIRLANAFAKFADYPRPMPPYSVMVETTTDADGRFVFPRVPPEDVKIAHIPKFGLPGSQEIPITQITNLTLKAGETRLVTVGGQGRAVVGRVVLKNFHKTMDWADQLCWIESASPEPSDCPNFDEVSRQFNAAHHSARDQRERDAAEIRYLGGYDRVAKELRAYYSSPAGRQYWFSRRSYVLRFAADGSFRVDDVPAGKYVLALALRDLNLPLGPGKYPVIDARNIQIDVPEAAGGGGDAPVDLGAINMLAQLMQGEVAPEFSVKTLDGKTFKLSDCLGRYALLAFWDSTDARSVGALQYLRDTYDAFKDNPRFAMIGLSVDTNAAAARDFVAGRKLAWAQGFLGEEPQSAVADAYGIESVPFVTLVDPTGRIFALHLGGASIKSAVDAVLSQ